VVKEDKKRPAGVFVFFVSTPSVMLWKCTFWASSSLTRPTNPFTPETYPVNPTFEPPSLNEDRTVAMGLMDFVNLCFADETDRAVSSASIQGSRNNGI